MSLCVLLLLHNLVGAAVHLHIMLDCCSSGQKKVTLSCGALSRQWMAQVNMLGGNTCMVFYLVLTTVGQQVITKSFSPSPPASPCCHCRNQNNNKSIWLGCWLPLGYTWSPPGSWWCWPAPPTSPPRNKVKISPSLLFQNQPPPPWPGCIIFEGIMELDSVSWGRGISSTTVI